MQGIVEQCVSVIHCVLLSGAWGKVEQLLHGVWCCRICQALQEVQPSNRLLWW